MDAWHCGTFGQYLRFPCLVAPHESGLMLVPFVATNDSRISICLHGQICSGLAMAWTGSHQLKDIMFQSRIGLDWFTLAKRYSVNELNRYFCYWLMWCFDRIGLLKLPDEPNVVHQYTLNLSGWLIYQIIPIL